MGIEAGIADSSIVTRFKRHDKLGYKKGGSDKKLLLKEKKEAFIQALGKKKAAIKDVIQKKKIVVKEYINKNKKIIQEKKKKVVSK